MISFVLPSGTSYVAGDYLNVLPLNPLPTVSRVLRRFNLAWDSDITIKSTSHTSLPVDSKQLITFLLGSYVELSIPASKKSSLALSKIALDETTRKQLESLAANSYDNRSSVLDILEDHPHLHCPFGLYLSMLPPMRVRQYSTSSSPLVNGSIASITYNVLNTTTITTTISVPADSAADLVTSKPFLGVTTNYLSHLTPGAKAQISIKKSHYSFHLPSDPLHPLIMVCAGTCLAPFRAFVEERAALITAGRTVGPAMLFVGCKNSIADRLYASELDEWQRAGAVEVYHAHSQEEGKSQGCKYVQNRIWKGRAQVGELFESGAKVFVCGSGRLGRAVKEVSLRLYREKCENLGLKRTEAEGEKWFEGLKVQQRWSSDVFD